jgi:hypothetical protein
VARVRVLQRIAVCYVITAILALWTERRVQVAAAFACVLGYWLLMRFVPVPGLGVPTHDIRCSIRTSIWRPGSIASCCRATSTKSRAIPRAC